MTLFRINAGKYRHIITFQVKGASFNDFGEPIKEDSNWMDVYTTRAGIYPISGKEILTQQYVNSEISHRIHLRYNPSISLDSSMRVKFGERIFTIISPPIDFQEKNVEWQIMCKEVL